MTGHTLAPSGKTAAIATQRVSAERLSRMPRMLARRRASAALRRFPPPVRQDLPAGDCPSENAWPFAELPHWAELGNEPQAEGRGQGDWALLRASQPPRQREVDRPNRVVTRGGIDAPSAWPSRPHA